MNVIDEQKRIRFREIGFGLGRFRTGPLNAITDVAGIKVGQVTVKKDIDGGSLGKKSARTGVTVIVPSDDIYLNQFLGGGFILHGAGEFAGLTQVMEWGSIETPIVLTDTFSVGICSQTVVRMFLEKYPSIGLSDDVVIPLVGECDDSWLNDVSSPHITSAHILEAFKRAKSGPVEEGNVGAGTGMITGDFAGGIGTSSRKLPQKMGGYTVGGLVLSNFGYMRDLRFGGIPIGKLLEKSYVSKDKRKELYGSIISVIATDAPLSSSQLSRLAIRSALGIGRAGSFAAHGSGEIILAFSTGNKISRRSRDFVNTFSTLDDSRLNPLYEAVIDTTEEAIANAVCMATDMTGNDGHFAPAIPLHKVRRIVTGYSCNFNRLEKKLMEED